ncbi:MAG: TULIP family P47-like protein [Saprospiraceae bacterium]|nr:TULIP family P47-like protein [Saprospiraceae bacterium]
MPDGKVVLQSHDKPLSFHFPHLDEMLAEQAPSWVSRSENGSAARLAAAAPSLLAAAPAAVPKASTNGWDTVYAIRVPDVNQAIVKQKTSPTSFQNSMTDPTYGITTAIKGNFSDWQITLGGDGENLNMVVPVTTGTFTLNNKDTALDGAQLVIQIKLEYLPPPAPSDPTPSGTNHALKPKLTQETQQVLAVSVINLLWPQGKDPGSIPDALIKGNFEDWFNKNLKDFDQVFSAVDLNVKADQDHLQWLKPKFTGYAYADPTDGQLCNALFGVLCITTSDTDPKTLRHELSSGAIPAGQRSTFLIGQQLFMREVIFPGLPSAFKSADIADFKMINNGTEVVLADGAQDKVQLDDVTYGAITYHPYLDSFDLVINDTEIVTTLTAKVQISPGIITYVDIKTWDTLELVPKTDGTQTIGYKSTRTPTSTHRNDIATWVTVTEVIVGIIAGVVLAVAGKAAQTITRRVIIIIIGCIVAGIIAAIQEILEQVIAKGVAEAMPTIDPVVKSATDTITWPTATSQFTLTNVTLNESIQLSGEPGFAGPNPCTQN